MTEAEAKEIIERCGTMIIDNPVELRLLCYEIAEHFVDSGVEAVVGADRSGIHIARWVAYHLSTQKKVDERTLAFRAEKTRNGQFIFELGGAIKYLPGRKTLVVEETLTRGSRELIEATRAIGADVIGLGALCNRGIIRLKDVVNPPKMFALVNK